MKYTIGFIGVGNMGAALAAAACKRINPEKLVVTNRSAEKAKALTQSLGCHFAPDNLSVVKNSRFVILGVKPQNIHSVVAEFAEEIGSDQVLVTMAAGITIDSLAKQLKHPVPIIRILPNTPIAIGRGITLISAHDSARQHVAELTDILKAAGAFHIIPESLMDSGCVAAGCAPAFAYMFIDAIARGAESAGLPYETGLNCAANALLGAAAMLLESDKSPEELKTAVCSPGGSTIEGVKILESHGLYDIISKAVNASYRRNIELGKSLGQNS